uniref:Retrovirus-related Pol polyprotein from transposon TNT 1-94 n=1 Tax=Tanacetum cinerariifolium TaxID=118510 RepID=A0A6L2MJY8_TANCI|nr:retrovirus-related Pol polyprotein from transposon TNT 1-94 [Tanacetum cinerariifolium]
MQRKSLIKEGLRSKRLVKSSEPRNKYVDELSQKELQQLMIIVSEQEMNVEALQTKYPIIDLEIYTKDTKKYWKTIKVGNHTEKGMDIYLLVEKEYPLSRGILTQMLCAKLLVKEDGEMCRELIRKIFIQVCKLSRSLYGLKPALRQWNHELTRFLISLGYIQSKHDYSLFVTTKGEEFTTALVYVDDMLITRNSVVEVKAFKQSLDQKFTIKDLGLAKYFLGIKLCRTDTGMYLNQRKCILDLLTDAGLTATKPCSFPLPTQLKLALDKGKNFNVYADSVFTRGFSVEAHPIPACGGFTRGTINLGGLEVFKAKYFKKGLSSRIGNELSKKINVRHQDTKSSGPNNLGASFYEPTYIPKGFHFLGHYCKLNIEPMLKTVLTAKDTARNPLLGVALERLIDYTLVWTSKDLTKVGKRIWDSSNIDLYSAKPVRIRGGTSVPTVYFHPKEEYFPSSVPWFFKNGA